MSSGTKLIYLIGYPGVGKYTVACELAKHGYVVCDNHLINNPIFSLEEYKGQGEISRRGWQAIAQLRRVVFSYLAEERTKDVVMTNVLLDDKGDRDLFNAVMKLAEARGSAFYPIILQSGPEENRKRIQSAGRKSRLKSTDPSDLEEIPPLLPIEHANLLIVDNTELKPHDTCMRILTHTQALQIKR